MRIICRSLCRISYNSHLASPCRGSAIKEQAQFLKKEVFVFATLQKKRKLNSWKWEVFVFPTSVIPSGEKLRVLVISPAVSTFPVSFLMIRLSVPSTVTKFWGAWYNLTTNFWGFDAKRIWQIWVVQLTPSILPVAPSCSNGTPGLQTKVFHYLNN